MKKNQIFIKCGTEYKEMTKELLEACNLAGEIEKKFEMKLLNRFYLITPRMKQLLYLIYSYIVRENTKNDQ